MGSNPTLSANLAKEKVKRQKPEESGILPPQAGYILSFSFYLFTFAFRSHGGEGGIRTHGGRKPTPVFETGALIHYATSPQSRQKVKVKRQNRNNLDVMLQRIRAARSFSVLLFAFYLFTFAFLF